MSQSYHSVVNSLEATGSAAIVRASTLLALLSVSVLVGGLVSCSNGNTPTPTPTTLTLNPSTFSLTAGATGQSASLLLAAPAGSGMATVTVSGLPSGVTISPAVLSANPGVSLPIVMTAGASAAATTAMVTFSTSVNGQTASTQAAVTLHAATAPPAADFTLSLAPSSIALVANGSTTPVSVLATAVNGFSSNVQATITGLPSGITVQPSSFNLTPGTAANLTVAAANGTAPGHCDRHPDRHLGSAHPYRYLHGDGNRSPRNAVADFSLAINPPMLSLVPGATGQAVQVSATALNGFAGSVSVAISGLPAGVTAAPASLSLATGVPGPLTLTAANSTAVGTASVVLTATAGALTHTATLALTVDGDSRCERDHPAQRQCT